MDAELEKQHALLKGGVQKFTAKVSPLLVAMGLVQEAMGLTQALSDHCDKLKAELDKKNETPNPTG